MQQYAVEQDATRVFGPAWNEAVTVTHPDAVIRGEVKVEECQWAMGPLIQVHPYVVHYCAPAYIIQIIFLCYAGVPSGL